MSGGSRSGSGSDGDGDLVSVDESYYKTTKIDGRDYHKVSLDSNIYHIPCDGREIERQHEEHEAFKWLFDNALHFQNIPPPSKALDSGAGNCLWAREFAVKWPDCEVVVTDICPFLFPEEDRVPTNVNFQVDDLNDPFSFPKGEFDFVHSQQVVLGIQRDWRSYVRDCAYCLKVGGTAQFVEFYYNIQSDNGSIGDDSPLRQWSLKFKEACAKMKKSIQAPIQLANMVQSTGLHIRSQQCLQIPLSPWKLNPGQSLETAERFSQVMGKHIYAISEYLFLVVLEMEKVDYHVFMASVLREARDLSKKAYFPLYSVVGQKH